MTAPEPDTGGEQSQILSVVVTIVDGGTTLERCVEALHQQAGTVPLEVLVPFDDTVDHVADLASRYPDMQFLPMGKVETARPSGTAAGQHELFVRRRAHGLAAASGYLIAILEDRGVPRPGWAQEFVRLHESLPNRVIGGSIANKDPGWLNWAVFFCDFGRYEPPFEADARPYVSDVNICYKRSALLDTRELWSARYHETTVHWALQDLGDVLWLSPEPTVDQHRGRLRMSGLLAERFHWGRLFAYTRAQESTTVRRIVWACGALVLPALLFWRLFRQRLQRRRVATFLWAAPAIVVLLASWSAGEATGYITGRP